MNSTTNLHPPYFQMISEAITNLKDKTGSSQPAIAKFVEIKYQTLLPQNFKKMLSVQLKKLVKSEKLFKVKHSYKLSDSAACSSGSGVNHRQQKAKPEETKIVSEEKVAVKTKRLSQVKTPEALKKKNPEADKANGTKAAPEAEKGKRKNKESPATELAAAAATKRKADNYKAVKSSRPAARKMG